MHESYSVPKIVIEGDFRIKKMCLKKCKECQAVCYLSAVMYIFSVVQMNRCVHSVLTTAAMSIW